MNEVESNNVVFNERKVSSNVPPRVVIGQSSPDVKGKNSMCLLCFKLKKDPLGSKTISCQHHFIPCETKVSKIFESIKVSALFFRFMGKNCSEKISQWAIVECLENFLVQLNLKSFLMTTTPIEKAK